jgi:hypothetical protein
MKLTITLLIASTFAMDQSDIEWTDACNSCIHRGWTYCMDQSTGFYPYFFNVGSADDLYEDVDGADFICENPDEPEYVNDPGYFCTNNIDKPLAISACQFEVDKCGNVQEFERAVGQSSATVSINNMEVDACTYKIEATSGAPGFNVDFSSFTTLRGYYDGSRPEVTEGSRPEVTEGSRPQV